MPIKAGSMIHDAYGFVVDRLQTAGVNNLNIPSERINELGNWLSVATVRDNPDLAFDVESFDESTEFEALINFTDPTSATSGTEYDLNDAVPMDIIAPLKDGQGLFTVHRGLIVPYLTLEQSTWRFAIRQNATVQHTFRGDAYFYTDGAPYYEEFDGDGVTATFNLVHTADEYNYSGDTQHVVCVSVVYSDGTCRRLFFGDDYEDTDSDFTLLDPASDAPTGSTIRACYSSQDVKTYLQTVHQNVSVKPAAVRHRNVQVWVGDTAATPTLQLWRSVQSFEATRRVTLDKDEEFGNPFYVSQDFDIPDVSGSIVVKPRDLDDLYAKVYQVADVTPGEIAGPLTTAPLELEVRITDPDTGARVSTLYTPDARFTIPGLQGRVQSKQEVTFPWSSDSGTWKIYKGTRP